MASGRKNLRYFMEGEEGNMVVHLTWILFMSFKILVWQSPAKERIISDRKSGTFENSGKKKSIYKIHSFRKYTHPGHIHLQPKWGLSWSNKKGSCSARSQMQSAGPPPVWEWHHYILQSAWWRLLIRNSLTAHVAIMHFHLYSGTI